MCKVFHCSILGCGVRWGGRGTLVLPALGSGTFHTSPAVTATDKHNKKKNIKSSKNIDKKMKLAMLC